MAGTAIIKLIVQFDFYFFVSVMLVYVTITISTNGMACFNSSLIKTKWSSLTTNGFP